MLGFYTELGAEGTGPISDLLELTVGITTPNLTNSPLEHRVLG